VLATADIFEFEEFRLDRRGEGLCRRDERGVFVPLSVGSRPLDVLSVLVERSGELVRKEEIIAAVWGRSAVENANLTVQISALRRVLDQARPNGSCIQTVATRGYRFLPAVTRVEHAPSAPTAREELTATRRLAAILAADVAGYSRLMEADEEGTLARLNAHRRELIDPKIAERRGRIVKTTGDGMLVEFASVVDAMRCAAEIQRGMLYRETELAEERRIKLRIGVNLGDVIVEGDDIFGDGVNIAARLEGLAEPGGICVSGRVQEDAAGRLDLAFEDIGEQQLKNIARPTRVFRVGAQRVALAGEQPATPLLQPAAAPRLSIVVLPFANLSNDPEQQYFADGITEDLTTDLSRIAGMLVISRNTAFTYQGKRVDTKQIGRDLAVRYVLEGSVRRSGGQVRVNAQLIEAESDTHLWAERFDGQMSDLFALQDEVVSRIAIALNVELISAEAARRADNTDALDCMLRGRALWLKPPAREKFAEQISLFERALTLDPGSVEAQALLAQALASRALDVGSDSLEDDIKRAETLSLSAVAAAPRNPLVHFARGQVLRVQGRLDEAITEYETVLTLDRNSVYAYAHIGRCKILIGLIEEGVAAQEQAIRLSPRDPQIGIYYSRIGIAHLLESRVDEAIAWLGKARIASPNMAPWAAFLASAYALRGDGEKAVALLGEAQRLDGRGNFSSIARVRQPLPGSRGGRGKYRELMETTYFAGLRKAGMPEE
jgi:TolB-like protein/class 3 adenylate cyclase